MSLITRCPACTTLFKVVPDQLRVSEGWVRCGQCDEVFDANVHLQGDSVVPVVPVSSTSPLDSEPEPQHLQDQQAALDAPGAVDTEPQMPPDPAPELQQELAAKLEWPEAATQSADYDTLMDVRPGASFEPDPALHFDLPGELVAHESEAQLQDSNPPTWSAPQNDVEFLEPPEIQPGSESETRLDDFRTVHEPAAAPTFMRDTRKATWLDRPWVRRGLVVIALLLTLGLLSHVVWRERDRLAANVSDLRPALNAMCSALDCKISPYMHIDTVIIDSSSFVKIRGDVYRLNVTLKNTASIDIAAPAVELTLTDLQDQPMIRHVFSAIELGAKEGILTAGGELTTAVPIQVKVSGPADRISGYRLLAFYP